MWLSRLLLMSCVFAFSGCATLLSVEPLHNNQKFEQLLIGKWKCSFDNFPMNYQTAEGTIKFSLSMEFKDNKLTTENQMTVNMNEPNDEGALTAKSIDEYTTEKMYIRTTPVSGEIIQTVEPRSQVVISMFDYYRQNMQRDMEMRIKDKLQQSILVEPINDQAFYAYKIDNTKKMLCGRVQPY